MNFASTVRRSPFGPERTAWIFDSGILGAPSGILAKLGRSAAVARPGPASGTTGPPSEQLAEKRRAADNAAARSERDTLEIRSNCDPTATSPQRTDLSNSDNNSRTSWLSARRREAQIP